MSMHEHHSDHSPQPRGWFSGRTLIVVAFFVIAAFLLFSEHRAHALGALIWLLPFACLLMHSFMHRDGHGHSHGHSRPSSDDASPGSSPKSVDKGEAP